jgi:hypothetical protein
VYYRTLNEVTIKSKYPLPRIDEWAISMVRVFPKINL